MRTFAKMNIPAKCHQHKFIIIYSPQNAVDAGDKNVWLSFPIGRRDRSNCLK